ncbi:hypothetical protein [Vibrio parahaemolyticus]|uniref:hypothetical protein n=1 Tax=Vibrio parahaemolyticus TaxID=670 RepID=UPI0011EEA646|nr:hypothetical protein [Vibrio parahaemolyticus]ELB2904307.1 hypothetical protein [Vibrio alginolyticus]KAB5601484.1 hypothetical protein F0578_01705 [Vibrio parahaemolyticus]
MNDYLMIAKSTLLELSIPISGSILLAISLGILASFISIGSRHTSRVVMLCIMFGLYGVVLGFFIGASKDSIVRDGFSSIVTIASGYLTFLMSKDLSSRYKVMIPYALICFLISLIVSATFLSKLRQAYGLV